MNQEQRSKDLIERLTIRAEIRRNNRNRKSVQEGKPDRLANLLEEAASHIDDLQKAIDYYDPYG